MDHPRSNYAEAIVSLQISRGFMLARCQRLVTPGISTTWVWGRRLSIDWSKRLACRIPEKIIICIQKSSDPSVHRWSTSCNEGGPQIHIQSPACPDEGWLTCPDQGRLTCPGQGWLTCPHPAWVQLKDECPDKGRHRRLYQRWLTCFDQASPTCTVEWYVCCGSISSAA